MKTLFAFTLLAAVSTLHAQSVPDCRSPDLPAGAQCKYAGTTLPIQKSLGDIALPPSQHARVTEPFGPSAIAPSVTGLHAFQVGAMFTVQTETLGFKRYVSAGGKVFAAKQWSDWRGLAVRGTAVETGLGIGLDAGNNHTLAVAAGPRVEHTFGRVTPYGEALVGFVHQYYYGLNTSGIFGVSMRLNHRLSFVPADVEYRYASLQDSTATANPRRGRIELSSGLIFNFGGGLPRE